MSLNPHQKRQLGQTMSKFLFAVSAHRAPFQRMIFTRFCLISLLCLSSARLLANGNGSDASAAPALSQSERMQWWSDARFGMFIHWGTYSVLGGVYKGKDYSKEFSHASAEWIKNRAKIPDDEYVKLAHQFNQIGRAQRLNSSHITLSRMPSSA